MPRAQKYVAKTDHALTTAYAIIDPAFFTGWTKPAKPRRWRPEKEATVWLRVPLRKARRMPTQ